MEMGWGAVRYSRQLHVARMLGAAGRGPWEVDEARAQGASCARLRSQGFSLWAAWPGGGQRAGIPTVAPSGSWVGLYTILGVAEIEAYNMLALMAVVPLRESPT